MQANIIEYELLEHRVVTKNIIALRVVLRADIEFSLRLCRQESGAQHDGDDEMSHNCLF